MVLQVLYCRGASLGLFKMMTVMHKRQEEIKNQVTDLNNCNTKLDAQSKVMTGHEGYYL
jgi:hypothetical protein